MRSIQAGSQAQDSASPQVGQSAIGIALYLKNPGITSYEVFGAFFRLVGSDFMFILLGVVLILSLFLKRPWCSYLCPLRAVSDYVLLMNNWVREKIDHNRVKSKDKEVTEGSATPTNKPQQTFFHL